MESEKSFGTSESPRNQERGTSEVHIEQMQKGHRPAEKQMQYMREIKEKTLGELIRDFDRAVIKYNDASSDDDNRKIPDILDMLDKSLQSLHNFHTQSSGTHYADMYGQNQYNKHQSIVDGAKEQTLQKFKESLNGAIATCHANDKRLIRGTNYGFINAIMELDRQIEVLEDFIKSIVILIQEVKKPKKLIEYYVKKNSRILRSILNKILTGKVKAFCRSSCYWVITTEATTMPCTQPPK